MTTKRRRKTNLWPLIAVVFFVTAGIVWMLWPDEETTVQTFAASVDGIHYGYEPLLLDPASTIKLENQWLVLRWPTEPVDPAARRAAECFGFSYSVWKLREQTGVASVKLGQVELPSSLGEFVQNQRYVIAIVRYDDGRQENVDLTPLSEGRNPRFDSFVRIVQDETEIQSQYQTLRRGVALNQGTPMRVVERGSKKFYILASAVRSDAKFFESQLRIYEYEPATADHQLTFGRSIAAAWSIPLDKSAAEELLTDFEDVDFRVIGDIDDPQMRQLVEEFNYIPRTIAEKFDHDSRPKVQATIPVPAPSGEQTNTPTVRFIFNVVDAITGEALSDALVSVNNTPVPHDVSLTFDTNDVVVRVTAEHIGYERLDKVLNSRILYDRTIPIELKLETR